MLLAKTHARKAVWFPPSSRRLIGSGRGTNFSRSWPKPEAVHYPPAVLSAFMS